MSTAGLPPTAPTSSVGATRLQELLDLVSEGERLYDQHDIMRKRASIILSKAESVSSPSPLKKPPSAFQEEEASPQYTTQVEQPRSDDMNAVKALDYQPAGDAVMTALSPSTVAREDTTKRQPVGIEVLAKATPFSRRATEHPGSISNHNKVNEAHEDHSMDAPLTMMSDFSSPPRTGAKPKDMSWQAPCHPIASTADFTSPNRNLGDAQHVSKNFSGSFQRFLAHRHQRAKGLGANGETEDGSVAAQQQKPSQQQKARKQQIQDALRAMRPNVACGVWLAPDKHRSSTYPSNNQQEVAGGTKPGGSPKKLADPLEGPKAPIWNSEPPSPIRSVDGSIAASYATPLETSHSSEWATARVPAHRRQ